MTSKLIEALKTVAQRMGDNATSLDSLSVNAHISPLGSADIPEPWKRASSGMKTSYSESNLESHREPGSNGDVKRGSMTPPFVRSAVSQDLSFPHHPRRVSSALISAAQKGNRKVVFRAPYGATAGGVRSSSINQTIKSAGLMAQIRKVRAEFALIPTS